MFPKFWVYLRKSLQGDDDIRSRCFIYLQDEISFLIVLLFEIPLSFFIPVIDKYFDHAAFVTVQPSFCMAWMYFLCSYVHLWIFVVVVPLKFVCNSALLAWYATHETDKSSRSAFIHSPTSNYHFFVLLGAICHEESRCQPSRCYMMWLVRFLLKSQRCSILCPNAMGF